MADFMISAHELSRALSGRWRGRGSVVRCPAHQDRTPSLSVAEGDDGLPLVFCHAGCTQEAVLDALRALGLWPNRGEPVARPTLDSSAIQARQLEASRARQHRLERARTVWRNAAPNRCHDLVRAYLRSRGLTIEPPPTIRGGRVWHCFERHTMPAMIAAIQNAEGRLQGVHITFLRPDGRGKAQIERPRLIHGEMIGGAVRLAPAGPKLGIAEGIENAATAQQEAGLPCWAALSACNLHRLELPAAVQEVVIIADRGEAGEAAAQAAVNTYRNRVVRIAWPPRDYKDLNAALQPDHERAAA